MKYFLLYISVLFILSGCTEEEVEKKIKQEQHETRTVYESNESPREVGIYLKDTLVFSKIARYCWNENLEVCEELPPPNPKEVVKGNGVAVDVFYKGKVIFGDVIRIYYDKSNLITNKPIATKFELMLYHENGYIPINIENESLVVPEIKGDQHYVFKVINDNEIKGISYQVFVLSAQPE